MPATPHITLTATLDDIEGNAAGTTANPAKLRIALCGYGPTLPVIVGTSNLAKVGPFEVYSLGAQISIPLWGNDQVDPINTYYEIAVLDGEDNMVQCGAYRFTGTGTIDLSNAQQIYPLPPPLAALIPVFTNPPTTAAQNVDSSLIIDYNLNVEGLTFDGVFDVTSSGGVATFDLSLGNIFRIVLTQNVTTANFNNPTPGAQYTFIIVQNGTGGWTFAWPAIALNPVEPVNPVANGKTLWTALCDTDSTLMSPGYYP